MVCSLCFYLCKEGHGLQQCLQSPEMHRRKGGVRSRWSTEPTRSPLACWRGNPGVACASWRGQLLAQLADLPVSFQEPRGFSFAAGDRGDAGVLLVHSASISCSCDCKAPGAWSRAPYPHASKLDSTCSSGPILNSSCSENLGTVILSSPLAVFTFLNVLKTLANSKLHFLC